MALAINGTPVYTQDTTGTATTVSGTITTTVTDTVVIAVITSFEQAAGQGVRTVSGVSGGGLTWAKRSANSGTLSGSNIFLGQEVWWAHASGTLTAQSITATFNAAANQNCEIFLFAVSGSPSPNSPWDSNASLPATANHMSISTGSLPSVTGTASGAGMALEFLGYEPNALPDTSQGSTYTAIKTSTTTSSFRCAWGQKTISAGSVTFDFSANQDLWVVTGDVLTSVAPGVTGTVSTALTKASQSASGKETFTGAVATHLTKTSQSAAGKETFTGTVTTALSKVSQSASDSEQFIGTITTRLTKATLSLAASETFTGTVSTALTKASMVARGGQPVVGVSGLIETDLTKMSVSALAATLIFKGTITMRLSPANFAATGEERFIGHANTRLGSLTLTGSIVENAIQALEIIEGPIVMELGPFNTTILGAKLGTPGDGKWYSYRYLDS